MPFSSILLILALLILVALFIARPFLQTEPFNQFEGNEQSGLLAERERIIEALLELDFDQRLGKVPEDIYAVQRQNLLKQGAETLQKLEKVSKTKKSSKLGKEDELEALIAARRGKRS